MKSGEGKRYEENEKKINRKSEDTARTSRPARLTMCTLWWRSKYKWGEHTGVHSDEVICLLAHSSFDSLCPSQAPRCQSHPWVVLLKAWSQMLVSAVGGSSGSGCQCWLWVWEVPTESGCQCWCQCSFPNSSMCQEPVSFPAHSGFTRGSILPNIVQFWFKVSSSQSRYTAGRFHHIIPWHFLWGFPICGSWRV